MLRAIVAVVVGYATMFVFIFLTFTAAYFAMGTEGAFQAGSYEVSGTWLVVSFVLGLLGSVAGGFVCAWIARRWTPPLVLAGVCLAFGLLLAIPAALESRESKARPADVSNADAMMEARTPTWVALVNPVFGAAGVLIGARMRGVKS
jgi:hypothetical protein